MSNGNGVLANRPQRVKARRLEGPRPHKFVDFHANATDFQCVLLAAIGWGSAAIAEYTGLTEGQVQYRIGKAETDRRKGEATARQLYRTGKSTVAQSVVAAITSKSSTVKKQITTSLDKRGLYSPRPRGVLKDKVLYG